MHYLYDRPEASFKDLLLASMRAKVKLRDHHLMEVKAITVMEPKEEAETLGVGLNDLNEQLKSLGQYLKSTTFMAKSKFSKSNRDTQNQSQGLGPSASGPFQDRPTVQCYKCNGWGHYQRKCPNREKVTFANERENSQGEEMQEGGSTSQWEQTNPCQ